ncbi:MAG: hypothetical protein ACTSO7_17535 [Candidatus Heimdallarchaeota archaeon]
MPNSNKEVSTNKNTSIEFRINDKEKEKFIAAAENENKTLSEYIITTIREKILQQDIIRDFSPSGNNERLLERLRQLEIIIQENHSKSIDAIKQISPEHKEDLLMKQAQDKIFWMLHQEEYQKENFKETIEYLKEKEPSLKPYLEESSERLFTALDLAIEKLAAEKILKIARNGYFIWKKN